MEHFGGWDSAHGDQKVVTVLEMEDLGCLALWCQHSGGVQKWVSVLEMEHFGGWE